jgi:hypothetical protein
LIAAATIPIADRDREAEERGVRLTPPASATPAPTIGTDRPTKAAR